MVYYNISNYYNITSSYNITLSYLGPIKYTDSIRLYDQNDKLFNEWLAGYIDGDGHFFLSKGIYPTFRIDCEFRSMHVLHLLQNKLGGSIYYLNGKPNTVSYYLGRRYLSKPGSYIYLFILTDSYLTYSFLHTHIFFFNL